MAYCLQLTNAREIPQAEKQSIFALAPKMSLLALR